MPTQRIDIPLPKETQNTFWFWQVFKRINQSILDGFLTFTSSGNGSIAQPSSGTALTLPNGTGLVVGNSNSGATNEINVLNTSNTASSQSLIYVSVGGSSAGDPFQRFNITGVQDWVLGVDNSDSDAFVIASSSALGSSNVIRLPVDGIAWKVGITTTVSGLPSAATATAGARAFVTDANATTFASVVAGGGANGVPVYSDGTNWRIG